jgi:uncharacterized protein YndB with AHSA1/START domain
VYEIHVHSILRAPIDRVFDAVSDHEGFFRHPGIERCVVTRPGDEEKNGLGAVRELDGGGYHFIEEIVRFERPSRFDYRIRSLTRGKRAMPIEHELGWLELSETAEGTRVDWRSRFRFRIPLIGRLLERAQGPQFAKVFSELLEQAKGELEARG